MSVRLHLSNGEYYSVSKNSLINDEEFENDQEILDYILSTYKTYPYYEVKAKMSLKHFYIFTDKICCIEIV